MRLAFHTPSSMSVTLFVDTGAEMVRYFVAFAMALAAPAGTALVQAQVLAGGGASSSAGCPEEGGVIAPVDADTLAARLGTGAQPRDEFESTDAYQARLAAATKLTPSELFVSIPLDKKYITYDADAGAFAIQSYAVDNENASWDVLGNTAQLPWRLSLSTEYVDLVVKRREVVTGTYAASNAFGATRTIRQIARTTVGILERPALGREDLFFPDRPRGSAESNLIARVTVPAAHAPIWRMNLRAAALIQPKAPLLARGKKDWGSPTITVPKEVDETLIAIVADIRCVVLTDQTNRVLLSIPTR